MKKNIKMGFVLVLSLTVLMLSLTACGKPENQIVGEWEYKSGGRLIRSEDNYWGFTRMDKNNNLVLSMDGHEPLKIIFYEDGTCKLVEWKEVDGQYEIIHDGTKLSFSGDIVDYSYKIFSENEFKIEGNELTITFWSKYSDDEQYSNVTFVKK